MPSPLARVWQRLSPRVAGSAASARRCITVRRQDAVPHRLAAGAWWRELHRAGGAARRPGEAERLGLLVLEPGAAAVPPLAAGGASEWRVLRGEVLLGTDLPVLLRRLDAWRHDGGDPPPVCAPRGARVLVREAAAGHAGLPPGPQRATAGGWQRIGSGLARRPLAPDAYLLHIAQGGRVPPHRHARDEECLMLAGEVWVGEQLLRPGDLQIAPAGAVHAGIGSERGALVYVHGEPEPERLGVEGRPPCLR